MLSFRQQTELGTAGIIIAPLLTQGTEADVTGFDRLVEHHLVRFAGAFKATLHHRFAPLLAVHADIDFIILHIAVGAVHTRRVSEALHVLDRSGIEIYPMRELRQCHAVHGVPDGRSLAVGQVCGISFARIQGYHAAWSERKLLRQGRGIRQWREI